MWTCAKCGELLDLAFDQCWRCANQRQLTAEEDAEAVAQDAYEEGLDAEDLFPVLSPEALAAERAALRARASEIAQYEGGHQDPRTAALIRIQRGYALYRERKAAHAPRSSPAHARLDRLWSAWLWGSGGTLGLFLAVLLESEVLDLFGEVAVLALLGGLVFTIWFGYYLAGREIAIATRRGAAT